jgi:hypothetical protein
MILLVDWNKYAENLEKLKAIKTTEMLGAAEADTANFPPDDEIALRHELITPEKAMIFINKNMRVANLDPFEKIIVRKASNLVTWLIGMSASYKLQSDPYLKELVTEIKDDISVILNVSVSKKGWLVDNILNPKKRFTLFGERIEKRGLFNRGGGENQQ